MMTSGQKVQILLQSSLVEVTYLVTKGNTTAQINTKVRNLYFVYVWGWRETTFLKSTFFLQKVYILNQMHEGRRIILLSL